MTRDRSSDPGDDGRQADWWATGKVAVHPSDPRRNPEPAETPGAAGPDLIGLKLTLCLGVGILATLAAFFLIGPVAGILVLVAGVAIGLLGVIAAIRRAEVRD